MKKRNLWIYIFGITIIIIGLIKLDTLISMVSILWNACRVLVFGAMMAFVINLVMTKIEKRLDFMKKGKRATSLLLSLILIALFLYFLITLVVPSLTEAIGVIVQVLPKYFENAQKFLVDLFENNPQLANSINNLDIDWKNLIQSGINVLSTGVTNVVGTTFNVVTVIVNSVFNFVLMFIFAIYVLLEKERFVQLYHRLTKLYLSETVKRRMDKCLHIINQTFSAFIGGQCIEATILGTLCTLGMIILRMPYPAMIGTLVGVINIIPMIGAYIGGAIGMFMVFTVSPIMSLWFLLYLCILQQIESNVIYPHVVGNSVGLPGIYVMMTVVIFGSLAGIPGMFLGIPTMASVYKIGVLYLSRKERLKEMNG
ncbi:AI-2E family transporter [Holdemanella biformis]|uniref:AI-2E family transporter n=1 Tax=Holdemanella biformis TaxID=1735 RepID=UPI0022DFAEDB|nr:AI-2E family transporter [Holdemanella biformis]